MSEYTSISVNAEEKERFEQNCPEGLRNGVFLDYLLEQYEESE
jgi:hypothetical protein